MDATLNPPRKRGRPPGTKNKPKTVPEPSGERLVPPSKSPGLDYRHADPDALIARQFSLIDWAQQALRNKMMTYSEGVAIDPHDIKKLMELSNALARNLEGMRKHADLAEEMAKRLTGKQLLEAALRKIEGQDLATLNECIKHLRAHRKRLAPITQVDILSVGGDERATTAIATLDDDEDDA
jgi:hypothetical protein